MNRYLPFLLLFASILPAACGEQAAPVPAAAAATEIPSVVAEGILLPDPSVELSFSRPGIVAEVLVEEGERVSAGQVLARLENSEAAQAEVARAEQAFLLAEQAFNTSEGVALRNLSDAHEILRKAQREFDDFDIPSDLKKMGTREALAHTHARLEEARKNFEPYKYLSERLEKELQQDEIRRRKDPQNVEKYRDVAKLYKKRLNDAWADYRKAIQWMELEANVESAKANADNMQKEYDNLAAGENSKEMAIARAQFESARADLDAARAALANVQLHAPIEAQVYSLDLAVGESVDPGRPAAFLGDEAHWLVETKDLAEIDVARVAIGDPAIIKLDAYPHEEFSGTVTEIDPVGREYLGDMTYRATIALTEPDPRFFWNMTATVAIAVE